jgi:hypothetical protein
MSNSIKAIEESIKIALDAADTATSVTAEFESIRTRYEQARKEVKTMNRHALGIFISSVGAIAIAVGAAGFMYYRTLGEMRASSATTMEALLIFAENVDKLVLAIGKIETLEQTNARLLTALEATTASVDGLATAMQAQPEAISGQVMAAIGGPEGPIASAAARIGDGLAAGFVAQTEATTGLAQSLKEQRARIEAIAAAPAGSSDLVARLDAMLLLQQEVSAKLTAMQARTPAPAPAASTPRPQARTSPVAPPAPAGDVIKFP